MIRNTRQEVKIIWWIIRCVFSSFLFFTSAGAEVSVEAIAKLQYSIAAHSSLWIEGYQSIHSGSYAPYQSHRSGMNRDSAYVVRTSGGEDTIEWNTAVVPQKMNSDSLVFMWVCGFGNNQGTEWFDLDVNDAPAVSFSTINDGYWSLSGKNGTRLSFTAVYQNPNGANFGFMSLTLSHSEIVKGKSVKIRIRGRLSNREIWYRIFPYTDAIRHFVTIERKEFYSQVGFIHMGDATLTFCAPLKYSGVKIQLYNSKTIVAEDRLHPDGLMAVSKITIPRGRQTGISSVIKINGKSIDTIFWAQMNNQRLRAFMNEELVCSEYVFLPGEFPTFRWKNEIMVENELGNIPLTVTFYNGEFQQVESAGKPGRYGAVIEGKTSSGFIVRRYVTLFCSPVEFDEYSSTTPLIMKGLKGYGIGDVQWMRYQKELSRFSFGSLKYFPLHDPDAAVFLAGLQEMKDSTEEFDTPRMIDRQWWITLKNKREGRVEVRNPLHLPQLIKEDTSTLLSDSVVSPSVYDPVQIEKLRSVCRQWAEKGGIPFVAMIVHKGKIIFHEAFGIDENGAPETTGDRKWMASITKLFSGVLMMQFVDQHIIDLDAPVSRYLPELSGKGIDELTVRHLFTHTTGLDFAGEWASDWNQALENQVAQVLPVVEIGKSFSYNRVGYAVAGKIMERLTGTAVPYLFRDYIFSPLGMTTAFSDNTYGGLFCLTNDLARFGQMLLNKGIYNNKRLFSEESFTKMLPRPLFIGDRQWGVGTSPMGGHGLSDEAFGHGAASGSIFRIDPKNDLIIIAARNTPGKGYEEFANQFIEQCTTLIRNR